MSSSHSVPRRPERNKKADPLQRQTLLTRLGWRSFPVSRLELNTDSFGVLRPWWLSNQALMWSVLLLFRPQTWTTTEPLVLLALSRAHCKYGNSSALIMYLFSFLTMVYFQILLLPFKMVFLLLPPSQSSQCSLVFDSISAYFSFFMLCMVLEVHS